MIRIEGLTIVFESFKIEDLHIQIDDEEFHFLLGPTGSGKTLILESIMGLFKPKQGKIWIGDREVQNLPPEQREISYVPQDLALFPHLKVRENILFGIRARNHDPKVYEKYIDSLIDVMRIGHLLERYPANLSGGEKKRVALLRALAPKPKLLLLDEPLSGLDPSIKAEIQHLLKILHSSFHPTTLCVTHDFEEAYFLGDGITICIDGRVEQVGKRDDVFLRPRSRKVAQFLGAKNLYRAKILRKEETFRRVILGVNPVRNSSGALNPAGIILKSNPAAEQRGIISNGVNGLQFSVPMNLPQDKMEVGDEVDLFIRPEEVMIIREGKPVKDFLKQNIFEGKILDTIDRGRYHMVYFETTEGKIRFEISIPNYAFRNLNLSIGKTIKVALREESLWMMP
jgi:ABC-type Fe3+/spermidine/putrescine transport system ATPase subunit